MPAAERSSYYAKRYGVWERNAQHWGPLAAQNLENELDRVQFLPESCVESSGLFLGLDCRYAGDAVHGNLFLSRAVAVADKLIGDDKCRSNPVNEAAFPKNLGVVIRGRTYSRWLLGEALDRTEMRRVAQHMVEWCLTKALDHKRIHDSMTMSPYMEGVRAAMVGCDLDLAAEFLRTKHKFRWHHAIERDLWTRLIAAYPEVDDELNEEVEVFFDRVRDPDFEERADGKIPTFINRSILALETGIIRQMYVVNASALDPVDPEDVIREVAW